MFSRLYPSIPRTFPGRAGLHVSRVALASKHTSTTYQKEVDTTPPSDNKIHRVDPTSTHAEKPHEPHTPVKPPTRAQESGMKASTEEGAYESVSKAKPYDMQGKDQRYGGLPEWSDDKGSETSGPGEGPEGEGRGGRKPEGRGSA